PARNASRLGGDENRRAFRSRASLAGTGFALAAEAIFAARLCAPRRWCLWGSAARACAGSHRVVLFAWSELTTPGRRRNAGAYAAGAFLNRCSRFRALPSLSGANHRVAAAVENLGVGEELS